LAPSGNRGKRQHELPRQQLTRSHGIPSQKDSRDLAQFLAGEITDVTALTQTIITARPKPVGGAASHLSQGAVGELKPVENEDYVGVLVRFASGAVGTFESSRVAVGPRAE